jgi:dTDP-4-dehydrorhamnose 3,5-epimerase-like enzyme
MKTTLDDILLVNLKTIVDPRGNLSPIESGRDIPFEIKRIFYVYGMQQSAQRGFHSHKTTQQFLICLSGAVEVTCKDGVEEKKFLLNSPKFGLFIPEMLWDELTYLYPDSTLLVLSSTFFDKSDYITDFTEFKKIRNSLL